MSMGGGGGGDGVTRYDWNDDVGYQWRGDRKGDQGILGQARLLSQRPWEQYGSGKVEDRIASLTPYQLDAIKGSGDFGQQYMQGRTDVNGNNWKGSKESSIARESIYNTLAGNNQNPYSDTKTPVGSVLDYAWQMQPGLDKVTAGKNEYAGMDSPYYQSLINKGAKDITKAYQQGTQANTTKLMNMSGVFGGGAHVAAEKNNQDALATSLGDYMANMGNTQYDRSGNYREADIGRGLGAQQFNVGTGQQDYQAAATRALQARGQDVGNQMQGSMYDKSLGANNWEAERNRQMQAIPQAFGADSSYNSQMQNLMGAGDAQRQYNQSGLDFGYNQWKDLQDWDWNQLGRRANIVSQAQGGVNPTATTSGGYTPGISPLAGLLGAAGLYGAFK